ncbi:MAG: hypothetical protein ACK4EY_08070 [Flavipsychrobacter sp.]|jgi:hypothetical protein
MKYLILFLLLPAAVFAQSRDDYDKAFGEFVKYYNKEDWTSICKLMSPSSDGRCLWKDAGDAVKEYGKIIKYQYLGVDTTDPERVTVYKITFADKKVKAASFNFYIEKDKRYFGTFRFTTESDEILRMLKSK